MNCGYTRIKQEKKTTPTSRSRVAEIKICVCARERERGGGGGGGERERELHFTRIVALYAFIPTRDWERELRDPSQILRFLLSRHHEEKENGKEGRRGN